VDISTHYTDKDDALHYYNTPDYFEWWYNDVHFDNGYSVLKKVRQFPGDPWKRVQQDMSDFKSTAGNVTTKQSKDAGHRRLTQDEAMELSSNLLEPENMRSEIQAFMYAWDGSIQFQGEGPMSKEAMSKDVFMEYFAILARTCNLPEKVNQQAEPSA